MTLVVSSRGRTRGRSVVDKVQAYESRDRRFDIQLHRSFG